ncbi:GNAT family N-acetyltransferase [Sporolactobacillus laevolacticus]|uniref:N-acetyltransferase GCN5 n=1 Tax=Sporolactobacillus laevolacticus DSM 442 TaxID=1395513 RepID=V6IVC0_9BACL|nr:GNAT family N-acetyltransferase [Sporolactobacillus laevolacticus]EST10431.1 N-acetyltransferase GCN5 [Sporolactobacillus laevolacticus DSM 442]
MDIRLMTIDDYEEVYQIWTATSGMGLRSLDDSKDGIAKFLLRNPTTNFVSVLNGEIIGVILCGNDGRRGYIYHTVVKPTYRGRGIGKALLEAVYYALDQIGITRAGLMVLDTNELGKSFWQAQGWEQRVDLNYYSKAIDPNNVK